MRRVSSTVARIAGAISLAYGRSGAQSHVSPVAAPITAANLIFVFVWSCWPCSGICVKRRSSRHERLYNSRRPIYALLPAHSTPVWWTEGTHPRALCVSGSKAKRYFRRFTIRSRKC